LETYNKLNKIIDDLDMHIEDDKKARGGVAVRLSQPHEEDQEVAGRAPQVQRLARKVVRLKRQDCVLGETNNYISGGSETLRQA